MVLPLTSTQKLTWGTVLFACGLGVSLSVLLLTTTILQARLEGLPVSFATVIVLAGLGIMSLYSGWRIISGVLDEDGLYPNENENAEALEKENDF